MMFSDYFSIWQPINISYRTKNRLVPIEHGITPLSGKTPSVLQDWRLEIRDSRFEIRARRAFLVTNPRQYSFVPRRAISS